METKHYTITAIAISLLVFFTPFFIWQAWFGDSLYDSVFSDSIGNLPVQRAGRIMPLSSASADVLRSIGGRASTKVNGQKISSTKWLCLLNAKPEMMASQKILKSDNKDYVSQVGGDGRYFSYNAFTKHYVDNYNTLYAQNLGDSNMIALAAKTALEEAANYVLASNTLSYTFPDSKGAEDSLKKYMSSVNAMNKEIAQAQAHGHAPDHSKFKDAMRKSENLSNTASNEAMHDNSIVRVILLNGLFKTPTQVLFDEENPLDSKLLLLYAKLSDNIASDNIAGTKELLGKINSQLLDAKNVNFFKVRFEHIFNAIDPFFGGFLLYGLSLIMYALSALFKKRSGKLCRVASVMMLAGLCAHVFGIIARMYIQGRPPVTNMYSSIVFTGAVATALGFFIYAKKGYLSMAIGAATLGFVSLLVAQNLPYSGDSMGMMMAVLNSNFWLTAHVVTIMVGYCGVFLAGFIAVARLIANLFSRGNFGAATSDISKSVYAILCFSLIFSFAGTMLGGIWADMSWGRFWGWDPKENGALMIVLWIAICIHCKALRLCSDRIFLSLAVFGNVVTAWAWFGVNLLGVGLHSYGYMSGGWKYFFIFVASQILIMPLSLKKYKAPSIDSSLSKTDDA